MGIFDIKSLSPMLIADRKAPFNSVDWIYELKLDGIRVVIYKDDYRMEIRNKTGRNILPLFPELSNIYKNIHHECILDGEIIVMKDNSPSFFDIQRRVIMTNPLKIKLASQSLPAAIVIYDIIYYKDKLVTDLPIENRKELIKEAIQESSEIAISRYIQELGIQLFEIAKQNNLEGVVAKRLGSRYYFGKRSKDWVKFKNLQTEHFIICGYSVKEKNMTSLLLGQYKDHKLIYSGSVQLGVSLKDILKYGIEKTESSPFGSTNLDSNITWLKPSLVCLIEYMYKTKNNVMRLPVYKGIVKKKPEDCKVENIK
jgi:ATP-dependent DNA ligase